MTPAQRRRTAVAVIVLSQWLGTSLWFSPSGVADGLTPGKRLTVKATGEQGTKEFGVTCRIDTPNELDYYRNGGILAFVLRQLAKG